MTPASTWDEDALAITEATSDPLGRVTATFVRNDTD